MNQSYSLGDNNDAACRCQYCSNLLTLPAQHAAQGPSVCPVDRQRQRHAAGLLPIGYRSISAACRSLGAGNRHRSIAPGAGARAAASVDAVIRGGSTQICIRIRKKTPEFSSAVLSTRSPFGLRYDTIRDGILTCARKPT